MSTSLYYTDAKREKTKHTNTKKKTKNSNGLTITQRKNKQKMNLDLEEENICVCFLPFVTKCSLNMSGTVWKYKGKQLFLNTLDITAELFKFPCMQN